MKFTKLLLLAFMSLFFNFEIDTHANFVSYIHGIQDHNKVLHGYKAGKHFNTTYIKASHTILSKYRPIDKSKIVFKQNLFLIPTNHTWLRKINTKNYVKIYSYENDGKWKFTGLTKIPKKEQKQHLTLFGYKVDTTGYKYNTYYDKSYGITSNYSPKNKAEVIFKYGTTIDPTKYIWNETLSYNEYSYWYKDGKWQIDPQVIHGEP